MACLSSILRTKGKKPKLVGLVVNLGASESCKHECDARGLFKQIRLRGAVLLFIEGVGNQVFEPTVGSLNFDQFTRQQTRRS